MRYLTIAVALAALLGCSQSDSSRLPLQGSTLQDTDLPMDGSWELMTSHRSLEPYALVLQQSGTVVSGYANVSGLDPAGGEGPVPVPVDGSDSASGISLDVEMNPPGYAVHFAGRMDGPDRLTGELTFSDALGGGSESVVYLRH